jgi:phosphoribosylamine--glycine ligase
LYQEDIQRILKRKVISGLETVKDLDCFHAGTKLDNGNVVSNGGRVLAVTLMGMILKKIKNLTKHRQATF